MAINEQQSELPDSFKLVDAAIYLGVYPGTLYRRYRYKQLPDGACRKIDGTLYFDRHVLESMRETRG